MSSPAGLTVEQVSHAYGHFVAADEINLVARPGEVHCLLGPSGSGKSTLLRLIAGLETLQQGRIEIAGKEVAGSSVHLSPEQRSVGFVFQDYALFPHLDVRRNIAFGMSRGSGEHQRERVRGLLARVGMSDYESAMPHTLSGGQQQRVALARALASEPAVMLLDEPFSGLDARLRRDVRQTTLDILHATDVATLMVTHDPQEALAAGDVISVIQAGRIVQTGAPSEVYQRSASQAIAEVFGPVNRLTGEVRDGRIATSCGSLTVPQLASPPLASPALGDPTGNALMADGSGVEILIRPESIELFRQPVAGSVPARISDVSQEGALLRITVTLDDGVEVEVHDLARQSWRTGDQVFLTLNQGAAIIHRLSP